MKAAVVGCMAVTLNETQESSQVITAYALSTVQLYTMQIFKEMLYCLYLQSVSYHL